MIPSGWVPLSEQGSEVWRFVMPVLELVRFGAPVHGLWCPRCAVPSAACQRLCVVSGLTVHSAHDVTVCEDCGGFSVRQVDPWT